MERLEELFQLSYQVKWEFIYTLVVILVLILLKWVINRFITHKIEDISLSYRWRKLSTYLLVFLAVIVIVPVWVRGLKSLATFLGLFSAGLAIALRDLLSNIVGWLFILWKRPFSIGDRIEIGGTAGDVIDIRLFQFSLIEIGQWVEAEQSTGRVVHIANSRAMTSNIANYTAGFSYIWNEIPVLITFESNWERAKEILLELAREHAGEHSASAREKIRQAARKYLIYYGKLTPIVYTRVRESGILLTIRYLCEPQQRRTSEALIWEDILKSFAREEEIEFAYPTRRFYIRDGNQQAGKGNRGIESGDRGFQMAEESPEKGELPGRDGDI